MKENKEKYIEMKFDLTDLSVISIALYDLIQERLEYLKNIYENHDSEWSEEKIYNVANNTLEFLNDSYDLQYRINEELNKH